MYFIAQVDESICSMKNCRLCAQFCPEPNTILYDEKKKTAFIAVDRCKGCEVCLDVCDNLSKNHGIKMVSILQVENGFEISKCGLVFTIDKEATEQSAGNNELKKAVLLKL